MWSNRHATFIQMRQNNQSNNQPLFRTGKNNRRERLGKCELIIFKSCSKKGTLVQLLREKSV